MPYRVVAIPDLHYPLHDVAAVNCVRKIITMVKPDEKVFLGDIGEWESVSEWRYKRQKRPRLQDREGEIQGEISGVNDFLDSFPKTKKTVVLQGNHDQWLDYFHEEYPYSGFNQYLFKNAIRVKERGWKYLPYGERYVVGKLHIYHGGHYTTTNHTKQHVMNLGVNVLYGHMHDVQRASVAHADGYRAAWCIGCLKKIDSRSNMWLKGRSTNWGNACAIIDFAKNGSFRVDVVDITAGKTFVWGREISG